MVTAMVVGDETRPAKRVIVVASGKGGVGKSTVALNVARALRVHGATGILDLDFYGPNIPAMLGVTHSWWMKEWTIAKRVPMKIPVLERNGLQIMSAGLILGDDQPLGFDAQTAQLLLRQFVRNVMWHDLEYLVVDLPPGTSAVQHMLLKELRPDAAIVVVTPQELAHLDARKAVQMLRAAHIRVIGGVENMTHFCCEHCGGTTQLSAVAPDNTIWAMGIERLASLPFDTGLAQRITTRATRSDSVEEAFATVAKRIDVELRPESESS